MSKKKTGLTLWVIGLLVLQSASTAATSLFILKHLVPVHLLQMALPLVLAGLLSLRYRIMPIITAVYGSFIAVSIGVRLFQSFGDSEHLLYNPVLEASDPFTAANLGQLVLVLAVVILSMGETRNRYSGGRQPGRWIYLIGGAAGAAMLLGVTSGLLAQANWIAGISHQSIAVLPVLEMKEDGVVPASLESRTGEALALRVVNLTDNSCHILEFPDLDARVHVEEGRTGLLFIRPDQPGVYTYQCQQHHDYVNPQIQGKLVVRE